MNLVKSKNIKVNSKLKRKKIHQAYFLAWLICGFSIAVWSVPAVSADRISFTYGILGEFYVSIEDLETFAHKDEITPSFAFYADRVSKAELAELRNLLNRHFDISVVTASTFLNLPIGKELTQQISLIVDSPAKVSQPALRASLILAAAEPEGLTILNVLRQYSTKTLKLNTERIIEAVDEATNILTDTEQIFNGLDREAVQANTDNKLYLESLADLSQSGTKKWRVEAIAIESDRENKRQIDGVVYLPVANSKPAPLVVIAPGLNTDWQNFSYIAEHLASYGFGVAAVNFPDTNARRVDDVLNGLDTPPEDSGWVEQPKVITRMLDEIELKSNQDPTWKDKLDLQRVGIIGQSLGGYTAMAIAGVRVDWQHLKRECQSWHNSERIELNPSLYWQCQSIQAAPPNTDLRDKRIVAAIAVNPVTNPVFSKQGMSQMRSPIMIITGDKDLFAPALDEQIEPFTWLPEKDKYLVLVKNSTHFSFISKGDSSEIPLPSQIIGFNPAIAHTYLKVLSVAFFQTHLARENEFESYLTETYFKSISKQQLPLNLLRSLNGDRLEKLIEE